MGDRGSKSDLTYLSKFVKEQRVDGSLIFNLFLNIAHGNITPFGGVTHPQRGWVTK